MITVKPKYKCPECGCDVGVKVWTYQDFGEYLVACAKCGTRIIEFEKEVVFSGGEK